MDNNLTSITYVSNVSDSELYKERIENILKRKLAETIELHSKTIISLVTEAEYFGNYQWLEMFMYCNGISEIHKCTKQQGVLTIYGYRLTAETSGVKVVYYFWID